jgi:hypothetical protein
MAIIDELLNRDLKKEPILLVNKRLNKYRNSKIPDEKKVKIDNLLLNSNIYEAIEKEKITRP